MAKKVIFQNPLTAIKILVKNLPNIFISPGDSNIIYIILGDKYKQGLLSDIYRLSPSNYYKK